MRLVPQMRLACRYQNQTHFLPEIVNSRANESMNAYLYAFGNNEDSAKHVCFTKRVWSAKCVWRAST